MKRWCAFLCFVAGTASALELEDFIDRVDDALTFSALHDNIRARLSGTIDLECYHFSGDSPGLINTTSSDLFNPRLTLFLDAQIGPQIYFFAQSRIDRGFDPSMDGAQVRLDEYAARFTPWSGGRMTLQVGKFATIAGTFSERHLSWENPFINGPLPYESVTDVSDIEAPPNVRDFIIPFEADEKYEYIPIIWGPNYATGISVSGKIDKFDYALEMKNSALSSRPESWDITNTGFNDPTFTGHVDLRPSEMWKFGLSASEGAYLRPEAEPFLPRGKELGDYRQFVLGQDISFAWHHWQAWAEVYGARFEVPRVGNADTLAYYLEVKYKFTPQLFGALRWNQQFYGDVQTPGGSKPWDRDLTRVDAAVGYRFTPHSQLKVQYTLSQSSKIDIDHMVAAQFTLRF